MATRALQQVVEYLAWNTSTNAYVTGDVANHSTSWSKDGTRAATTNSAAEVDATNMPGLYKVTMTATETDCIQGTLGGKSSTANVVLIPTMVAFDYLNTSAPATAGIPDVNVKNWNNQTAQTDANNLPKVDVEDIAGSAVATGSAQLGVNVVNWHGGAVPAPNVTGEPLVDLNHIAGAALSTHASGMVPADVRDIAGSAVATGSAQLGVNVVNIAGQAAALDANNLLKVDVEDINGNAVAAQQVSKTNQAIVRGVVGNASSTTSIVCSSIASPASLGAAGQLIGRTMIFDSNTTTANLQSQATNITNNTTGATPTFTVTALTTAPVSGDTFSIV
jgi:hypothetical protein